MIAALAPVIVLGAAFCALALAVWLAQRNARTRDEHCFHMAAMWVGEHESKTEERCCFCGVARDVRFTFEPHPAHGKRLKIERARRTEEPVPHGCVR